MGGNFLQGLHAAFSGDGEDTGPGWKTEAALGLISQMFAVRAPEFMPLGATASGLGDLSVAEARAIQQVVDKAGRPIDVVGSAARGARKAGSDIDYIAGPSSIKHFEGLERRLPGLDRSHGIMAGTPNRFIGPSIRFEPGVAARLIRVPDA